MKLITMPFKRCGKSLETRYMKTTLLSNAYIHTLDTSPTSLASFAPKLRPVKHTFTQMKFTMQMD